MKNLKQNSGNVSFQRFWSSTAALVAGLSLVAATSIAYGQKTTVEAENMSPTGSQAIKMDVDGAAGHGKYVDFVTLPTAPGSYIEFTIPSSLVPGTYALNVFFKTKENRGIWQASIDGVNVGPVVDEWDNTPGILGVASQPFNVLLTSAGKKIRLTVVNKNPLNSTSYYTMTVDWFEFTPVFFNLGTVTDIDGNVYRTITLGSQEWTIANLKTTKLNDGTPIQNLTDPVQWGSQNIPAYCWYDNSIVNKESYGALYNFYAVATGKLAPVGWRVPRDEDWTALETFLIANGFNWDGSTTGNGIAKAMAAGPTWTTSPNPGDIGWNLATNNKSCFLARPAGDRNSFGVFQDLGNRCYWYSSTPGDATGAWDRTLSSYAAYLEKDDFGPKNNGYSIRVVRDLF